MVRYSGKYVVLPLVILLGIALVLIPTTNFVSLFSKKASFIATNSAFAQSLPSNTEMFPDIVEEVLPTVVTVYSEQTIRVQYWQPHFFDTGEEFLRRFFGGQDYQPRQNEPKYREYQQEGLGSGVIVSEDGFILTNNHVVLNADEVKVKVGDNTYPAEIVGADEKTDIAVLKIATTEPLKAARLGNSDEIRVGEWVLAIGQPFNLDQTVTAGIISAKGRNRMGIADYEDFIQTDAAINPGNSGGALINLRGELIGINTAISTRTGVYNGIGFAIPINLAESVMDQLIENGYVVRGYIGISIQDITPKIAQAFGLDETDGVLITQVMPNTPAKKAGLATGDIVLKLNGENVENGSDLRNRIASSPPGSIIKLAITRNGDGKEIELELSELPNPEKHPSQPVSEDITRDLGLTLSPATERELFDYGYSRGLRVDYVVPESPAANAGVMQEDLIFEVNRVQIGSVSEYETQIAKTPSDKPVLFLIGRNIGMKYVAVIPGG